MSVDTKVVEGRRKLRFESFDEILADAEKLVSSPRTKTLGNWPLGTLLAHLGGAINASVDGSTAQAPWFIRVVGPFVKGRFLKHGLSPGFRLPKQHEKNFFPETTSPQDALQTLKAAVARTGNERMTGRHPAFGKLTHEEWTQFHHRHAELHLSFAVPE